MERLTDDRDGGLNYRAAGVDIDAGDVVVDGLQSLTRDTPDSRVLGGLGHFGGFFRIGSTGANSTLVSSIDGVGTKLVVASLAGRFDTIGEDLVNHCTNDILACGATPLFFLDYYGTGRLNPESALSVIGGIIRACKQAGITLVGGETAEMPGLYQGEDFDLVGAIVGMVDEERIIDGRTIRSGDLIVGLPSNGFHTNGYSLIRAALGLNERETAQRRLNEPAPFDSTRSLADVLLTPHRSYRDDVATAIETGGVRGMAHITGGGLAGNVSRIIPPGLMARIDVTTWSVPPVFAYVAEVGHVAIDECFRAFNMGIGFVVVIPPSHRSEVLAIPGAIEIGSVEAARGGERVVLEFPT